MRMSPKDRERLRALAAQQAALAAGDKNQRLFREWEAYGASKAGTRPMIRIETDTFAQDVIPPLMRCEGQEARAIEATLLKPYVNHVLFGDDTLIPDCYGIAVRTRFLPFGLKVQKETTDGVGHHFVPYLRDLEEDFHLLGPSQYGVDMEATHAHHQMAEELFGDILPVRRIGNCLGACPTQDIVHIMSMEDMYIAMYEAPALFHQMMDRLTDDYLAFFQQMAQNGQVRSAAKMQHLNQGSYCFTDELPDDKPNAALKDCWLYMDSQETSGISPQMYAEFVFPYYEKLMRLFGLISYGCCEAVHPIWTDCLSRLPNLRKVSVSPWCDEADIGEKLRGTGITYLRKPPATLLGIGDALDERAVRACFRSTALAAKGCKLEIAQRDVYQINGPAQKVKRYVALAREELEK